MVEQTFESVRPASIRARRRAPPADGARRARRRAVALDLRVPRDRGAARRDGRRAVRRRRARGPPHDGRRRRDGGRVEAAPRVDPGAPPRQAHAAADVAALAEARMSGVKQ